MRPTRLPLLGVVAAGAVVVLLAGCSGTGPRAVAAGPGPSTATAAVSASASGAPGSPSAAAPSAPRSGGASGTPRPAQPSAAGAPAHFGTLPPSAALPSGAQCAAWVRAHPTSENKRSNRSANATTGQRVDASLFTGDASAVRAVAARVDGNFTGSTRDILRWTACKWGIDEDIVYAQTAVESWWRQDTLGDWGSDAGACPAEHQPGVDGRAGQCPQSYGVLQDRWPYMKQGWPGFGRSTAMNADLAYGVWRACFDGYETWLGTVEHGQAYRSGDAWGCVGRWFSGRWHTAAGDGYVTKVQQYQAQKIWQTADFQQP